MCPFTRRFTLKDSLVLVIVMPGAGLGVQVRGRGECSPQDSQASTISLDTIEQWQPSVGGAPQASVDDRITEILQTLNSLSAELVNISRARQQESSERLSPATVAKETRNENGSNDVDLGGESALTEEAAFQRWRSSCTTVKLNVGGKVFHVEWSLMLQVGGKHFHFHLSGSQLQAGPPRNMLQGRRAPGLL